MAYQYRSMMEVYVLLSIEEAELGHNQGFQLKIWTLLKMHRRGTFTS